MITSLESLVCIEASYQGGKSVEFGKDSSREWKVTQTQDFQGVVEDIAPLATAQVQVKFIFKRGKEPDII